MQQTTHSQKLRTDATLGERTIGSESPSTSGGGCASITTGRSSGDGAGEEETDYELNVVQMGGADEGTLFLNTVPRTSRGEEDFFEEGAEIVDFI